jgi:hypothetical protein
VYCTVSSLSLFYKADREGKRNKKDGSGKEQGEDPNRLIDPIAYRASKKDSEATHSFRVQVSVVTSSLLLRL